MTYPPHAHPARLSGKRGSETSETRLDRLEPRCLLKGLWRRPERQSGDLRALVRTKREILRRATRHTGRIVRAWHQLIQPPLIVEENDRLAVLTLSLALTWSLAVRRREWDDLGLHREVLHADGGDRSGLRGGGPGVPSGEIDEHSQRRNHAGPNHPARNLAQHNRSLPITSWFNYTTKVYNGVMALVFTFSCGGCGRTYSVYYPKTLLYELSGTAPREMGLKEDEEDRGSGAVDAARTRAEAAGRIFVDASQEMGRVCVCGKRLDFNIMHHPRVPQSKQLLLRRQTGLIPFPTVPKKP